MTPPSSVASSRSCPRGIVHLRPKKLVLVLVRFWSTKTSTRTSSKRLNPECPPGDAGSRHRKERHPRCPGFCRSDLRRRRRWGRTRLKRFGRLEAAAVAHVAVISRSYLLASLAKRSARSCRPARLQAAGAGRRQPSPKTSVASTEQPSSETTTNGEGCGDRPTSIA